MNVLHEIPVLKWQGVFWVIKMLLEDNGYLLFVEVPVLSVGENPDTKHGYLVLEEQSLNSLFAVSKETEKNIRLSDEQNAFAVPKRLLINVNETTIENALFMLKEVTEQKFRECREDAKENKRKYKPRKLAFHMQQYYNIDKAIEILHNG